MANNHLRQFYTMGSAASLSHSELKRIGQIHKLIPDTWQSLIDIGCGDGRVSNPLVKRGLSVFGVDFAESRLAYCEFETRCDNITRMNLDDKQFDGAICSEVLEHLTNEQIETVVDTIHRVVRHGFIVSVPAHEHLELHITTCPDSQETYHVWGHLHSFHCLDEVDALIGQAAVERSFVPYEGVRESLTLNRMRRALGWYPYDPNAVGPTTGIKLRPFDETRLSFLFRLLLRTTYKLEALTSPYRPSTGWFICRYEVV